MEGSEEIKKPPQKWLIENVYESETAGDIIVVLSERTFGERNLEAGQVLVLEEK